MASGFDAARRTASTISPEHSPCSALNPPFPRTAFHELRAKQSEHLPAFELYRCFWTSWNRLPEDAKAGRGSEEFRALINDAYRLCNSSYSSLVDLLHPESTAPAIVNPENGSFLTHNTLVDVISTFRLPLNAARQQPKPVVAISLPNGPLLAVTVLAVATYFTAAPIAHGNGVGPEQFKRDVLQSASNLVLALPSDVERLRLRDPCFADSGISVLLVKLSEDGKLMFGDIYGEHAEPASWPSPIANTAADVGILLFTSGTSGTKKLVPLHIDSMITGVAMVIHSWGLSASSRCLNQMPLNHVGGLIRNLLAPIMSGGSVICCSGFDANLFWDVVEDHAPTWYYASPSMHQCILEAGAERPESVERNQITLVCNAAGSLLPSLACQLRDVFSNPNSQCTVLPSYGMTECMPISTPPLTYKLQKTGTSGVSVGPEITILDGNDRPIERSAVGRIGVRGASVFRGYLKDAVLDQSCFTTDGWFDTGDMGYLDGDGYLYITGRSKEVINRGGELISPFEVEEAIVAASADPASLIHGRVSQALAFSAKHDVLQEVVGVVVVSPAGGRRACLRSIQEAVRSTLASVKVPSVIVYMDSGVPTNNNKVLRMRLAERLNLPTLSDATPSSERYYEATCPPPNAPLTTSIECHPLRASHEMLSSACGMIVQPDLDFHICVGSREVHPELFLAPKKDVSRQTWSDAEKHALKVKFAADLHGYSIPSRIQYSATPFSRNADGTVDENDLIPPHSRSTLPSDRTQNSDTKSRVALAFAETLGIAAHELKDDADFFELGGDSMKAGRLLSALRKAFAIRLAIDALFANSKLRSLTQLIDSRLDTSNDAFARSGDLNKPLPGCKDTHSSTSPILLLVQLLPIGVVYPLRRALTWTVFIYCLAFSQKLSTTKSLPGSFLNLVVSLTVGKLVAETVAPVVAVAFKWLVIGRYREGLYPMWGLYHTRWWLCQKVLSIGGMGIYQYSDFTRKLYYRCLGTRLGRNVTIDKDAKLGEYDLITIADGAVLDRCVVRPFAVERNTSMFLGKIRIGENSSVGLASIVAAGTTVPANTCIGPNSSSWEVGDADEANRDLSSSRIPRPHWTLEIFLGMPITALVVFVGAIPWMGGLLPLVITEPTPTAKDMLRETAIWFASPHRVVFHYVALVCNACLGPLFLFLVVVAVKKGLDFLCGGPLQPGPAARKSNMEELRLQLIRSLMPIGRFHKLTALFGTHYGATSVFARMLGAKVGRRVYWPGKGPSIQDWNMLDIGNDVVFGSRSHIVTSDRTGTQRVKIGDASMVADRVVLLPGAELGERTVMGSGALTKSNKVYPSGTTWVGSKKNDAICLKTENTSYQQLKKLGHRLTQYRLSLKPPVLRLPSIDSSATSLLRKSPSGSKHTSIQDLDLFGDDQIDEWLDEWLDAKRVESGYAKEVAISVRSVGRPSHESFARPDCKEDPLPPFDAKRVKSGFAKEVAVSILSVGRPSHESFARPDRKGDPLPSLDEKIPAASSSPFGRAFYQGAAPYRVWNQFIIACYSTAIISFTTMFWNVPSITAVQVVAWIFSQPGYERRFLAETAYRPLVIYAFFALLIAGILAVQVLAALATIIVAKWTLIGRRRQGNYDWDKSPYCQRWQLLMNIEMLRQKCYGGHGILGMLTGTHWIVLYFRALGASIGRDCALFASGTPSLYFTEPDLLRLGDRVGVDDASLVCHINTAGKFDLNPLSVGDRSVMRTGSRLLSGARMESDTCLLEHTLVMAGDVVDEGFTRQGWPGEDFSGDRLPTHVRGEPA